MRAEQCLLAGVMTGTPFPAVAKIVQTHHFEVPEHAIIWRAMESLDRARVKIDAVTLVNELDNRGDLDRIGGGAYIASLLDEFNDLLVDPDAGIDHANCVRDAWVRRKFLKGATE